MTCQHLDYDDYFEKCFDCGATVEEIHASECAGFDVDDEGRCEHCGCLIEEEAA